MCNIDFTVVLFNQYVFSDLVSGEMVRLTLVRMQEVQRYR